MGKSEEELLANVEATLAMEGLELSAEDVEALERCMLGAATFDQEVLAAIEDAKVADDARAA